MTNTLSDICSITPRWEASSTDQNKKHEQKQDAGLVKTHRKTRQLLHSCDSLRGQVSKTEGKLQDQEFLKFFLLKRNALI